MRISSGVLAAVLIVWAGAVAAQQTAAYTPAQAVSAQSALERGLGAYQAGRQENAVSAFNEADTSGDSTAKFVAEFYLARIYSENVGPAADHTKAYVLFRKIADENLDVDPDTSQRAPFVAKALIALARYVRAGISEIDLQPNPRRAIDYLHHAAVFFGDRDAQFELARTYLGPDASSDDVKRGLHYLSVLTEESYPAAQAMLADLFWHGRHVPKDERRGLALATMAVENAPAHERIWIEETYAGMFCAAAPALRDAADGLAARWRRMFARPEPAGRAGLTARDLVPERQCASGEKVAVAPRAAPAQTRANPSAVAPIHARTVPLMGYRAAGIVETSAKK